MKNTRTDKGYTNHKSTNTNCRKSLSGRSNRRAHYRSRSGISSVLGLLIAFVMISGIMMTDSFQSLAQSEPGQGKFYKSITVEKGDTLWTIAEEYMTDDYESVEEYISALKEINNLSGDKILSGDKLIVAYNTAL